MPTPNSMPDRLLDQAHTTHDSETAQLLLLADDAVFLMDRFAQHSYTETTCLALTTATLERFDAGPADDY